MLDELDSAYKALAEHKRRADRVENICDVLFTRFLRDWAAALKTRFPKRAVQIWSCNGNVSFDLGSYRYVNNLITQWDRHNPVFDEIAREFDRMINAHMDRLGVNFLCLTEEIRL